MLRSRKHLKKIRKLNLDVIKASSINPPDVNQIQTIQDTLHYMFGDGNYRQRFIKKYYLATPK